MWVPLGSHWGPLGSTGVPLGSHWGPIAFHWGATGYHWIKPSSRHPIGHLGVLKNGATSQNRESASFSDYRNEFVTVNTTPAVSSHSEYIARSEFTTLNASPAVNSQQRVHRQPASQILAIRVLCWDNIFYLLIQVHALLRHTTRPFRSPPVY